MFILEKAYAKINLLLAVTGKRVDGYHQLETVYQSLALHDTLKLTKITEDRIVLTCDDDHLPVNEDNLVWRAAQKLKLLYEVKQGVHIHLEKKIPVAAGLAGGSSDAAATLRGLVHLWQLPWEEEVITNLAAQLGSDVPFCLYGGTALGTGRGEKITRLPQCPPFYVVLANPGFYVPTASVYAALRPDDYSREYDLAGMLAALKTKNCRQIISHLLNMLEPAAFRLHPAVKVLKTKMNTSGSALLSGSGPTVFALFASRAEAEKLAQVLLRERYKVWLTETFQPHVVGGLPND
ncbi:MAG: 4-(cytidine 5'-diphospho)-2-C-methyl-D-erythritol kinase [Firmicutes bacterium]|nr:4-(cytidine 5'-diphospho)-2-C-methyl-D-erythritol kinase [Bacillota bacterium]